MKKIIFGITSIILFGGCANNQNNVNESFKIIKKEKLINNKNVIDRNKFQSAIFLNEIASSFNKQLPMNVDKETRIDAVLGTKKNIFYNYTLVNYKQSDINAKELKSSLINKIKNNVCTNPKLKIFSKNGVNMNYIYYGKNGKYITEITIKPEDCNF